ncbi:MAG: methyltransferase domain-containing protein, partial [Actinomycetota bacterium]|nr:methyltransferase domain-containing protein [Actinomycetota bacterium]
MTEDRDRENALDYAQVRAYWEDAAGDAGSASYMAHEQGLPQTCIEHRFALEQAVLDRWFAQLTPAASVLDIGCGAGAWTEYFAGRYRRVVGIDASNGMVAAARRRLAGRVGVEVLHGDALTVPIGG